MLKFKVKGSEGSRGKEYSTGYLFADDVLIGNFRRNRKENWTRLNCESFSSIAKIKYGILFSEIQSLALIFKPEQFADFKWLDKISFNHTTSEEGNFSVLTFHPKLVNWTESFSIVSLFNEASKEFESFMGPGIFERVDLSTGRFSITFQNRDISGTIGEIVLSITQDFYKLLNHSFESLKKNDPSQIKAVFNFPKEIRTSCEQYLIYFAQFLADLGVEVNTSITHSAGETLFKVVPNDPDQALNQIRDALNIYLDLPSAPDSELSVLDNYDVAANQLKANIYHLKGQLSLADAMIQRKDATISSLNLTIFNQEKIIEVVQVKKPDEEPLIDGIVSVKDFEWKGFKIKLPEIARWLKRKL